MITIKDIAKKLNVSPSTVSRALNDSPQISEKMKQRVRQVVKDLDYTPNRYAQGLIKNNTYTIGIMIPDILDSHYSRAAYAAEEVIRNNGHELAYTNTQRDPERVLAYLKKAVEYRYNGVFITPDFWEDRLLDTISKMNIPVISLRRKPPQGYSDILFVDSDHYSGMREAVERLIELGHTSIGYIGARTIIQDERAKAYKDTMRSHGLTPCMLMSDTHFSSSFKDGYELTKALHQKNQNLTAITASQDVLAAGALEYLNERGISVPEQFSVIGQDDRSFSNLFCLQLSTVQQALQELGRQAAMMMLEMINNPECQPTSVILRSRIIERKTTGICL